MSSLVLRVINGIRPFQFQKLLVQPTRLGFHSSAIVEGGRRTGSTAHEPKSRAPSKQQKKRRRAAMMQAASRREPSHDKEEKTTAKYVRRQIKSPEIQKFIKETDEGLERSLPEMLLPKTVDRAAFNAAFQLPPVEAERQLSLLQSVKLGTEPIKLPPGSTATSRLEMMSAGSATPMTLAEVRELDIASNRAMRVLLDYADSKAHAQKGYTLAKSMREAMKALGIPVSSRNFGDLIKKAVAVQRANEAEALFNEALDMAAVEEVADEVWAARIHTLADSSADSALALFEERLTADKNTSAVVYNAVMQCLNVAARYSEVNAIWLRMHENGVKMNAETFATIMNKNMRLGEAERAFFHFDEMKHMLIKPTEEVFKELIAAAGTAPYWVNGYQDTIFDALCILEGNEFIPTEKIYNEVIRAFAKAGDSVAAEYYFWEMRRKGILPTTQTYDCLMDAYARAQLVKAHRYGTYGRYVRPKAKELTKEEKAYHTLGPVRVAEIMSSNYYAEVEPGEGKGRRTKYSLHTLQEGDAHASEEHDNLDEIMMEASLIQQQSKQQEQARMDLLLDGGGASAVVLSGNEAPGQLTDGDSDSDSKESDDPDLKRLISAVPSQQSKPSHTPVGYKVSINDDDRTPEKGVVAGLVQKQNAEEVRNNTAQLLHASYVLKEADSFYDPFAHVDSSKGRKAGLFKKGIIEKMETDKPLLQAEKTELVKMLDRTGQRDELEALRGRAAAGSLVTDAYTDYQWDLLEFGRAPEPDYSAPLEQRQEQNKRRAEMAFQDFLAQGLPMSSQLLTKYLSVFVNIRDSEGMERAHRLFDQYNMKPIVPTYRALIFGNILNHNMDRALQLKDEMVRTLQPDAVAYGMIVESLSHRSKIVEALQVMEEASEHKLKLSERNLMNLRARCESLGVYHPDLGADPKGWVKDMKQVRINKRWSSKRGIQNVKSALY